RAAISLVAISKGSGYSQGDETTLTVFRGWRRASGADAAGADHYRAGGAGGAGQQRQPDRGANERAAGDRTSGNSAPAAQSGSDLGRRLSGHTRHWILAGQRRRSHGGG